VKTKGIAIDFENSIAPWIGRTSKIVDYHLHEAMQRHGLDLSKEQMIVLKKLHEHGDLNQNELALLTYRDKSSLARLLSKMEQKNYIFRRQNEEDKRINDVFLTEQGKLTYQKTRPVIKEIIDIMEQNISQEEKQHIIKILKKVQENFITETALF
jgi:DNA-binding MarR family transcriptional regulator